MSMPPDNISNSAAEPGQGPKPEAAAAGHPLPPVAHIGARAVTAAVQAVIVRELGRPLNVAAEAEVRSLIEHTLDQRSGPADLSFERREVTILLADLRGFTALAAMQPAGVVITVLNRCLEKMSEVIFRHRGTIDKFMGDSLMVLFGAPQGHKDDVLRALVCAVEMQLAMQQLNASFRADGLPELYMGIGLNTGLVMAGRFGSQVYSEYTVIGDAVNLASRIEAFSLRGQVLVSEATYLRCVDEVSAGPPMEVFVKGKSEPVTIREVFGLPALKLSVPRLEERRSHRVEVDLPARVHCIHNKIVMPQALDVRVRDVGYFGLLLESHHPLAVHDEVKLGFELSIVGYTVVDLYGKVVGLKPPSAPGQGSLFGVEFTSVPPEANARIQTLVQMLVSLQ